MKNKTYLGRTKDGTDKVFLEDFSWDCGWYWGGGYIGNNNFHCHFDGCFLDVPDERGHPLGRFTTPWNEKAKVKGYVVLRNGCAIWEGIETFLNDVPEHIKNNWWRIKDLFKQFYTLKNAAEVYQYGGRCSDKGRTEKEINKKMANAINKHIEKVIIPEIRKVCQFPE